MVSSVWLGQGVYFSCEGWSEKLEHIQHCLLKSDHELVFRVRFGKALNVALAAAVSTNNHSALYITWARGTQETTLIAVALREYPVSVHTWGRE